MIDTKELRRLAQAAISKMNALDPEFVRSVTPLAVLELLDRLEAAEQTAQDYLRIDGEKARIAQRLEAAEKSDAESLAMYRKARDERDALRAEWKERNEFIVKLQNELRSYREREKTMGWNNG